jgi:hypothetical protein
MSPNKSSKTVNNNDNNDAPLMAHADNGGMDDGNAAEDIPKTNPMNPLQAESVIAAGLMRIADRVARTVLPWQAVLCPRAVESLHDLRLSLIQTKHITFMIQMKAKLEEKVVSFMQKKETEVDVWIEKEVLSWQKLLADDEIDLGDFVHRDMHRITARAMQQDIAYRQRELHMANEMDDRERDQTREMLDSFRRIVRASKDVAISPSTTGKQKNNVKTPATAFGLYNVTSYNDKSANMEVRVLQDSIAKAQGVITNRKTKEVTRTNIR